MGSKYQLWPTTTALIDANVTLACQLQPRDYIDLPVLHGRDHDQSDFSVGIRQA